MPRSRNVVARVPNPVRDAMIRFNRGEYGDIGNDLYTAIFPVEQRLTVDISKMHDKDQDIIHDFVLQCAEDNILIGTLTDEKPLHAQTLLKLARSKLRRRS